MASSYGMSWCFKYTDEKATSSAMSNKNVRIIVVIHVIDNLRGAFHGPPTFTTTWQMSHDLLASQDLNSDMCIVNIAGSTPFTH